jgi:hypothetical protein
MPKKATQSAPVRSTERARQGKDEMNLAVFPIAALSVRVPKNVKALKFEDTIQGEGGKPVKRAWTVQGGADCGLPTAGDEDVYVALMELTRQRVNFSRYELARRLGWSPCGKTYKRIEQALLRLANVNIYAQNAFWDHAKRSYVTVGFSIIQEFRLYDEKPKSGQKPGVEPPSSFFMWSERLYESFKSGYIKFLDTELYFQLSSATARRLFRYLDKKFGREHRFSIDVYKLAHEHLGISRNFKYVSQLIQQMRPALDDLTECRYLRTWEVRDRVISFIRAKEDDFEAYAPDRLDGLPLDEVALTIELQPDADPSRDAAERAVIEALVDRGVTRRRAAALVRPYAPDRYGQVSDTISYFDWLIANGRKKPDNPAGFLVTLIQDELPFGASTAAERRPGGPSSQVSESDIERHSREELAYTKFVETAVNKAIQQMGQLALAARVEEKVAEFASSNRADTYKRWSADLLRNHAELFVRKDIAADLGLPDFEAWRAERST